MNKLNLLGAIEFATWNAVSRLIPFTHDGLIVGSCNNCGKCCTVSACAFYEAEASNGRCSIYESPIRRLLNCSSFPVNNRAIELSGCEGFKYIPSKVIPIRSIWQE